MLTDIQCRAAKGRDRDYKLADGLGLYLYVTTSGFRSWRMKFRTADGREKRLTFGPYPDVTLEAARAMRNEARQQIRSGLDPSVVRKQRKAEAAMSADTTFRTVAIAWHGLQTKKLKPRYAGQILQRFELHIFPILGTMPIRDVTAAMVLQVVRAVEAREAHDLAHRVRQYISDVFVFAIASGWAEDDPAHVIRKALAAPTKGRRPAATRIKAARHVLEVTEKHSAYGVTKLAARLLALTAARPGVVRLASPAEFEDLDGPAPLWRIPAEKMKLTAERRIDATYEFVIPLSHQAVAVVKTALELVGPTAPLLFPSSRNPHKPMTDSTLSALYRNAGLRGVHVPHGWRATFSTIMNELAAAFDREGDRAIIDMMLAHIQDGVEAAYNRAAYMPRRRAIAQEWADLLAQGALPADSLIEGQHGSSQRSQRRRARDRANNASGDARPRRSTGGRRRATGAPHTPAG